LRQTTTAKNRRQTQLLLVIKFKLNNVGNGVQHVGNTEEDRRYANRDVYDGVAINAKVNSASGNIGTLASATIAAWIRDA